MTAMEEQAKSKSGMAIAGLVLGIVALVGSWIPILNNLSAILALLGLVFGIVGMVGISRGKKSGKGLAIAAIIVCVVSFAVVMGTQSMYSAAIDEATDSTTSTAGQTAESGNNDASAVESATNESTADSDVPTEYKSALNKAETYSSLMHMSKQGIYDQLTSEYGDQFSAEAAQYAVDNVQADWNANALASAQSYQENMSMSPEAIRDQLTSEYGDKFTQEEADYAVANLS